MPRTIRTKIYKFNELSKKAKQTAIDNYLAIEDFGWIYDEAWESLKAFSDYFDISMDSYDYNEPYRSRYSFKKDDTILELSGLRLRTYLLNNYYSLFFERRPYGEYEERDNGKWRYDRYSNCQFRETCCPFTGGCYDDDLLDPMRQFLETPGNENFKDLLEECLSSLNKSVQGEIEGNSEEDAIADHFEANDYEFTADGRRF
jgi:hypothetical protein